MALARCIGYHTREAPFMNSQAAPAPYRNAQTPEIELVVIEDGSGAELRYRLFLRGQPVAAGVMRGAKLVLARALADLAVADYRRRPSDDPGPLGSPPPWN